MTKEDLTSDGSTVDDLLLTRLTAAELPKEVDELLLDALGGAAEATAAPSPEPTSAYLTSIEVNGFRGIGAAATLELIPGPGLTIVTGRNGSGKSSFAEAAELALTGDNQRWANRSQEWRDGWRNLHTSGERWIRVGLGLAGHRGGATVECRWADGADLAEDQTFFQRAGERRRPVPDLGWAQPMELYRPFLSYAELGGLLNGNPSQRYDSLHRVLGLDRLTQLENHLTAVRRGSDKARGLAAAELPALRETLAAYPNPRARELERLLAAELDRVDLDKVEALATDSHQSVAGDDTAAVHSLLSLILPAPGDVAERVSRLAAARQKIAELAQTSAARARDLAVLLQKALDHHRGNPYQPCPVCGGRTLDSQWAAETEDQLRLLRQQAEQFGQADQAQRQALNELRGLAPATPAALSVDLEGFDLTGVRRAWRRWEELLHGDSERIIEEALAAFTVLSAALQPIQEQARELLDARARAWQPVADHVRAWAEAARAGRLAAQTYQAADQAVQWLRTVGQEIRNDRLAPLATEAAEVWRMLRHDSNVDLGAIQLAGAGNRRRVDLNVAVDGESGAALGVMSQGELHALALSLFLPRATLPASPFRFLVIDDPVQSMDPAKVYGLAKVLERVAAHRQVVVFTHDERLPTAIRHLGIKAHLKVVTRHERSQVTVGPDTQGDPALRYLDDAWAVASDPQVDRGLRTRAVCVLVRDAIEARCHDVVMTTGIRAGQSVADLESGLTQAHGLRAKLALAFFKDSRKTNDVDGRLERIDRQARRVVRAANDGSHPSGTDAEPTMLVRDAQRLIKGMVI